MVDDVYVVQQKYGADMTTRTGDTTYGFNATADVWNEAMSFHNGEMATIFTIWDAGGTDTFDLSGYYTPSVIDLREGGYSSAGGYGAYDASLVGTNSPLWPRSIPTTMPLASATARRSCTTSTSRALPARMKASAGRRSPELATNI